ncbi:unnamed protein product [Chrysoparadoxa australica]
MMRANGVRALRRIVFSTTRRYDSTGGVYLSMENINSRVAKTSYAVRGSVLQASQLLQQRLNNGEDLPFHELVQCNIGNPQALLQPPISFFRQVMSLCMNPELMQTEKDNLPLYPPDVYARAKKYLDPKNLKGGAGAYTDSKGMLAARLEVASFIGKRDGHPADPEQIFLTNGASEGVRTMMELLVRDPSEGYMDGILTPIPQYPLYSARLTLGGGALVPYYLVEKDTWGVDISSLKATVQEARNNGISVRAMVVINPGNPTGQVLSEADVRSIVKFAAEENLVLLADEVYQENIWKKGKEFVSLRKAAFDQGYTAQHGADRLSLVSFHSTSKGFIGECGMRGGYFELHGFDDAVKDEIYKLMSVGLCSNVPGQIMTGLMVNPPVPGDPSFPKYEAERDTILASMKRRARLITDAFREMEGVNCEDVEGALYAFPRVHFPPKAEEAAKAAGIPVDELYCLEMLKETGVIMVPGSGFQQEEGTYHLRCTILPQEEKFPEFIERLEKAHREFFNIYR